MQDFVLKFFFQVSETVAFCCWSDFSKKHKIFEKHALIDSLKELLLMMFAHKHHNVGFYKETIHKLASLLFIHIFPSEHLHHPCLEVHFPSLYLSWLHTCLSFWVAYVPLSFSVHFSIPVCLLNKTSSLSMTT